MSRLKVVDEIETGLRIYPMSFFEVAPKVNALVRDALRGPILRPGSWISGDRDGNPNVTAQPPRRATGGAARTTFSKLEQELFMLVAAGRVPLPPRPVLFGNYALLL